MSAVIYEAIILVCRCRGREGCPSDLSLSSRPDYLRSLSAQTGDFSSRRTSNKLKLLLARYFTVDSGLRGLSAVVHRVSRLHDIET